MALTKQQKNELVAETAQKLQENKVAVFSEFNRVAAEDLKRLRRELKNAGAELKVLKKRLVNLSLKKAGINFEPSVTKAQLGTVFAKGDLTSVAALIHKFSKDLIKAKKGDFSVLAAYDSEEKRLIDANEFKVLATLPPREILLAQVAMMLMMPLKQLMMVINERSKQTNS